MYIGYVYLSSVGGIEKNTKVFNRLYYYVLTYSISGFMGMTSTNSYFYAAIVAIFAVHIVLGMFIYVAWKEGSRPAYKVE